MSLTALAFGVISLQLVNCSRRPAWPAAAVSAGWIRKVPAADKRTNI